MAGEWREATLDQLGRIVTGKTPPSSSADYFGGVIPFVTPTDFDGRRVINTTGRCLTEQGADAVGACRIPARAVMVSCIGSDMGKAAVAGRDCVTNQQINSIVVESGDDPLFVYYNLSTRKAEIRGAAGGSAQPILNKTGFGRLDIALPPLNEQRAIAHILGTLDDKIELNRRMSETLEAMARALFKSWFVDFDAVRAKIEGRDPGLPKPLADLFPARLVDSELGEIPDGWDVGCVDDEFDLTMGQSPPGETYNESGEGIPFYQGRADFESRFPKRRVYCTAPTRLAKKGDTLISVRAPVGDINMAAEDCAIGRGVAAARHNSGSRSYTYQFMLGLELVFARFEAEGTVFGSISKKDFHGIPCVVVPPTTIAAFERAVAPLDSRIEILMRESGTLAALRDTLLPKLISGELRVKDAEKFVGNST
jgi:type I restriction enzyme S subunit